MKLHNLNTLAGLREILSRITFRDWTFHSWLLGPEGYYIQVEFTAPCTVTGQMGRQKGGKFYISRHAALNEVIRTAYAAVKSAIEYEIDEEFKVAGQAIYHPHTSVIGLEAAQTIEHEYREEVV